MSHPRLDGLAEHFIAIERALKKRGIPGASRRRLLGEWADHAEDLYAQFRREGHEESQAVGCTIETIGTPRKLADVAVRQSPWVTRWPLVWFILFPIVGFPVFGIVYWIFAAWIFDGWIVWHGDKSSAATHLLIRILTYPGFYGLPIVIAAGLAHRAQRAGLSMVWPAVAAFFIFVIHCHFSIGLTLPQTPTGSGAVFIGIQINASGLLPLPPWPALLASSAVFIPIALHSATGLMQRLRIPGLQSI